MDPTYEIFKQIPDENPIWIGVVKGVQQAKHVLITLGSSSRMTYFAYDERSGKVFEVFDDVA
ncbi:MAG: hypothetical protein WBP79_13115 [Candidatus Acidiferrales bacterium]